MRGMASVLCIYTHHMHLRINTVYCICFTMMRIRTYSDATTKLMMHCVCVMLLWTMGHNVGVVALDLHTL